MAIEKRLKKGGTFSYRVRVQDPNGDWYPSETFGTEHEAKARELELEKKKFKGGTTKTGEARRTTLDDYWSVWSDDRRDETSPGWIISQDQMYRDHVKPLLGGCMMLEIKAPHIGRVLSQLKARGYADNTRKHVYGLLRQMFADAVNYYEMLEENPVKAEFHKPKVVEAEAEFWKPEDAWKFLEFAGTMERKRKTMLDLAPPAWLQIQGALRVGEAQALKWSNVLFGSDQIRICEIWNNKTKKHQPYPKGKKPSYVPMTPALKRFLLDRFSRATSEYVAPSWCGKMMSYDTYLRALSRGCTLAGLPILTTHSLRHSATEIWFQAGASTEDIRRLLNHAAGSSSTKRYIHRSEGRLQDIARSIAPGLRVIDGGVSHLITQNGEKETFCIKSGGSGQ